MSRKPLKSLSHPHVKSSRSRKLLAGLPTMGSHKNTQNAVHAAPCIFIPGRRVGYVFQNLMIER